MLENVRMLLYRKIAHVLACAFVVLLLNESPANAGPEDPLHDFDAYAERALSDWNVPGMAIAVVKDGKVVFMHGYGVCKIGETTPVDDRTVFRIASCTKSFTATCLGILVDDGKLKWDDPVVKHLPDFRLFDPVVTREITIRDLLCHRTGLESGQLIASRGDYDIPEILRRMQYLKQTASFRSRPEYQNLSYFVAGAVVEKVSGKNREDFVQEWILRPLSMNATLTSYSDPAQLQGKNVATPHVRIDGKVEAFEWDPNEPRRPIGAGGMHSSVADMAEWLRFNLGEGVVGDNRLLKAQTIREMQAVHSVLPVAGGGAKGVLPYPKMFFGYGLGWAVRDYRGRKLVFHMGSSGAAVAMIPEEKLGVVVLANLDGTGLVSMIMHDVFDRYLGIPRPWSTQDWIGDVVEGPEKAARESEKKRDTARVKGTKPSFPLKSFVGTYENDLYGTIEIRIEGERLVLQFGEMIADLSHRHYDMFEARFRRPRIDRWLITFVTANGVIECLDVELWQSGEKLPPFKRVRGLAGAKGNSIGMKLALIPAGEFLMGAPDSDKDAEKHEKPQHKVRITKPFYLGVHEVTVGEFRKFVEATGYQTSAETDGKGSSGYNADLRSFEYDKQGYIWKNVGWKQDDDHPVLNLTWGDALAFCRWLSKQENKIYRLPTEAEWEYACRGRSTTRYFTGDTLTDQQVVANTLDISLAKLRPRFSNHADENPLGHVRWWDDGFPFTAPVGSFKPNALGLFDMHGNAWEWCADWYGERYYEDSPRDDPLGPATGTARVIRGGGFLNTPLASRASSRNRSTPDYRNYVIGFRVLAETGESEPGMQDKATNEK